MEEHQPSWNKDPPKKGTRKVTSDSKNRFWNNFDNPNGKYIPRKNSDDNLDFLLHDGFKVILRQAYAEGRYTYEKAKIETFLNYADEYSDWDVVTYYSARNDQSECNHLILVSCYEEGEDYLAELLKHVSRCIDQPIETFTVAVVGFFLFISTRYTGCFDELKELVDKCSTNEFSFNKGFYDHYSGLFKVREFLDAKVIDSVVIDGQEVFFDDLRDYRSSWLTGETNYNSRLSIGFGESALARRFNKKLDRKRFNLFMRLRVGIGFH